MTLQTGQVLNNRYRIVKLLGQGGFGAVYRAWDTNFQLPCALKENTETSPDAQRQFLREAQILHTLRYPNLPLVKDYFIIPGQGQYLVMDYVEGEDLQELLERSAGQFLEPQVTRWLIDICDALAYMHSLDPPVIHRDIKPANIKITPQGKAMLVDFGISKVYDPNLPTTQGARAVTPGYSPFEQYGHAPTDARTDVYALGATAYCLLTGQVPPESIARMAGKELPPPRSLNPLISNNMERIINHAMEIMPADRYSSAAELGAALKDLRTAQVQRPWSKPQTAASATMRVDSEAVVFKEPASFEEPGVAAPEHVLESAGEVFSSEPMAEGQKSRKRPIMLFIASAVIVAGLLLAVVFLGYSGSWSMISPDPTTTPTPHPTQAEPKPEQPLPPPTEIRPSPTHKEPPPPREEPKPDQQIFVGGLWAGVLEQFEVEAPMRDLRVEFHQEPGAEGFGGGMEIIFPGGRVEGSPIEGFIEGEIVRFIDKEGRHFQGRFEGERIAGEIFLECFDCQIWGAFELFR